MADVVLSTIKEVSMDLKLINKAGRNEELIKAFEEVQQPRTEYQLRNFVVGAHIGKEQQYAQCVTELQRKYTNLKRAQVQFDKNEYELEVLRNSDNPLAKFDIKIRELDMEETRLAVIGAMREFEVLYRIWQEFGRTYTRKEIDGAQEKYWHDRITEQANNDIRAAGRIGVGNLKSLRQIGKSAIPELDHVRDIEKRYIEGSNVKLLIAVATEKKAVDGLPCLKDLVIPSGVQVKYYNCFGRSVADAYNDIAKEFIKDDADFLLTVEDDTFPPPEALVKLLNHMEDKAVVGGWYLKRQKVKEGAPIIIKPNGKRGALEVDGEVHEVYTIPMGCTLYKAEVFFKTEFPWFETTANLTQDSFFSQKLRDAGFKLYCDTSIRCKHIDRETSKVYE